MYDFEKARVDDGERAFGVPDTFRIHDRIYVLNEDADNVLLNILARHDYVVKAGSDTAHHTAEKAHQWSPDEILCFSDGRGMAQPLSLIIDASYAHGRRHALTEKDIHATILSHAGQTSHLDWYDREGDFFGPVIIARMTAFVTNLVDVEPEKWKAFTTGARFLHAQDFIKAMAAWASRQSDGQPREVREDLQGFRKRLVHPADKFAPRRGGHGGFHFRLG